MKLCNAQQFSNILDEIDHKMKEGKARISGSIITVGHSLARNGKSS
jgi:hypothetical protein